MAFAQQQRKPATSRTLHSTSEDYSYQRNNTASYYRSDSETDWHIISSALPSSSSQSSNSPNLLATTESYTSSRIVSDTEESIFSDLENVQHQQQQQVFLPSHDGTGTFLIEDSSDQNTSSNEDSEIEASGKNSLLDMIHGDIRSPSFVNNNSPRCIPTADGFTSQELFISSAEVIKDSPFLSDASDDSSGTKQRKQQKNYHQKDLDKIPIHHPGILGSTTSAAILSIVWDSLRRLRNHLIENDTNTVETISNLMSEAVFEGCMPFSSHLHMEFDNGIRTSSSYSLFEGHIAI
ncbi:uncharacterized protein BX663DRAFT_543389 [Cokeromyces recurvatus]|uniref:uncharacterized protein n=1 Tax=Cokeromyces recurvatus TaxID=90255 RepID=UPI002220FABC|nr:uncharacterized protein BX663DRAFT_543389 [Cokeromyces recurvatus]KAI7902384.1 hypothetical protein BX663DRAFT_543389 [Cokeromyces recurvatus]